MNYSRARWEQWHSYRIRLLPNRRHSPVWLFSTNMLELVVIPQILDAKKLFNDSFQIQIRLCVLCVCHLSTALKCNSNPIMDKDENVFLSLSLELYFSLHERILSGSRKWESNSSLLRESFQNVICCRINTCRWDYGWNVQQWRLPATIGRRFERRRCRWQKPRHKTCFRFFCQESRFVSWLRSNRSSSFVT